MVTIASTIVSVSLLPELLQALNAYAKRERRSRSFVVAEAVRAHLARQDREAFREARDQTLREGLRLSPEGRVKLAEELWDELTDGQSLTRPWARTFDTFEAYERWRREGGERVA